MKITKKLAQAIIEGGDWKEKTMLLLEDYAAYQLSRPPIIEPYQIDRMIEDLAAQDKLEQYAIMREHALAFGIAYDRLLPKIQELYYIARIGASRFYAEALIINVNEIIDTIESAVKDIGEPIEHIAETKHSEGLNRIKSTSEEVEDTKNTIEAALKKNHINLARSLNNLGAEIKEEIELLETLIEKHIPLYNLKKGTEDIRKRAARAHRLAHLAIKEYYDVSLTKIEEPLNSWRSITTSANEAKAEALLNL